MPSHLRLQSSFEPFVAEASFHQTSPTLPPSKKQKMSLTRTYAVASTARSKLGREASRADHNLRRLVGHANLLDTLMIDLADAEREQEAWFNSSVSKASPSESRHIQWFDSIQEDFEDDDSDSDSDSDAESDDGSIYDEDAEILSIPVRRIRTAPVVIESEEIDLTDDEDEAEYDAKSTTRSTLSPVFPASTHHPSSRSTTPTLKTTQCLPRPTSPLWSLARSQGNSSAMLSTATSRNPHQWKTTSCTNPNGHSSAPTKRASSASMFHFPRFSDFSPILSDF